MVGRVFPGGGFVSDTGWVDKRLVCHSESPLTSNECEILFVHRQLKIR